MNVAIVCEGRELEMFGVKQDSTASLTAFIASEAGKVSGSLLGLRTLRNQLFRVLAI